MALRLINPYFRTTAQLKAEQHAPAVQAFMQSQSANKTITLAELRAGLPAIAADLSRQVVNQICAILDIDIENPGDPDA